MNVVLHLTSLPQLSYLVVLCLARTGSIDLSDLQRRSIESSVSSEMPVNENHLPYVNIRKRHFSHNGGSDLTRATEYDGKAERVAEDVHNSSSHKRYHVAHVDFSGVASPLIVSLWIVFASIAKIGECLRH